MNKIPAFFLLSAVSTNILAADGVTIINEEHIRTRGVKRRTSCNLYNSYFFRNRNEI